MPGILPMKVIKVGTSSQTRIAQACDRCRSKKIRCDGVRPSCTQCVSVGFECKTSDKLTRRAFPRGYTESLEERVRALECEVRELKDLLDEKDEKIDMLSRIHSNSPHSIHPRRKSPSLGPGVPVPETNQDIEQEKDESFSVVQGVTGGRGDVEDAYYSGNSSGKALIDALSSRVPKTIQCCADIKTDVFGPANPKPPHTGPVEYDAPPRMLSDQLVNIFFQEWAPLFPVLHRPTFLVLYEQYVAAPGAIRDLKSIAQLNLVFGIAALSNDSRAPEDILSFERQWQSALEVFSTESCLVTLQCLALAQIHSLQQNDVIRVQKYKGLAVGLLQRLGLNQPQKLFSLGVLTSETRKKVFWTVYTLDCFSAAHFGLPKLLNDSDIHCEYPADADDEYINEKGFLPTLPGESTKLSSALALFRLCRTMSKVLTDIYPAAPSHDISFRQITALNDELDAWSEGLAPHLRLQFVADKPSTNIISSRSPILSLAYHYVRSMLCRPIVCASSVLGDKASSAMLALANSSKKIVQIVELLDERRMSFSFCLNKTQVLMLSAFGLLYQSLDLAKDGKLLKDNQRLVSAVVAMLAKNASPGTSGLRYVSGAVGCSTDSPTPSSSISTTSGRSLMIPQDTFRSAHQHLKALKSRLTSPKQHSQDISARRATLPVLMPMGRHRNASDPTLASSQPEVTLPHVASSEPARSPYMSTLLSPPLPRHRSMKRSTTTSSRPASATSAIPSQHQHHSNLNLDYLPFPSANNSTDRLPTLFPTDSSHHSTAKPTKPEDAADWERLISSLDNGQQTIYDTIYGASCGDLTTGTSTSAAVDALLELDSNAISPAPLHHHPFDAATADGDWGWSLLTADDGANGAPGSVLSFSEESLTSGSGGEDGFLPILEAGKGGEDCYEGFGLGAHGSGRDEEEGLVGLERFGI
ncbi:hypothetical protein K402DRAFT_337549 [Aulographum hederae CBS 113979]|uniref:Zn(2)-C6 fungal-type domain-containing protein n=1 Tax=Aulographum hederae CBS 113979 TaxID=1176131 RepID=A0A6G1GSH0_9PEZI|nr:hypothetical protein K402DRAFT_337549 [Aulographum hederae CBS 113979]